MVAKKPAPIRTRTPQRAPTPTKASPRKGRGVAITAVLDRDRETPNKVVFKERGERDEQVSGSFYISKRHLAELGNPDSITVTIAAG